jgi:protein-tyrosine phosphatase
MRQIWIIIMGIFYTFSFIQVKAEMLLNPIFDGRYEDKLPINFRMMKQGSLLDYGLEEGLYSLSASGSGQFSETSFLEIIEILPASHIIVVDLRQESHGFINGQAMSWSDGKHNWANRDKSLEEIESDESQRLSHAIEKGNFVIHSKVKLHNIMAGKSKEILVNKVQTEKEFIESLGKIYIRFPVQDHCRPSDQIVDQFIDFIRHLPPENWIHFHCRAGRGRTTTFLTLYDMMLNAEKVSLEIILARHKLLGGTDLLKIAEPDSYKHYLSMERLEFVKKFYQYCQDVPDFHLTWSEWVSNQS